MLPNLTLSCLEILQLGAGFSGISYVVETGLLRLRLIHINIKDVCRLE